MLKRSIAIYGAALGLIVGAGGGCAAGAPAAAQLKIVARIAGPDGGWDYASFDPARRRVYVAHGAQVMMINADTGAVTGNFAPGARLHAVVPIPGSNLLVTTNGADNTARIFNTADGKLIASVATAKDPDAAIYDPSSGLVLVMGADSGEITMVDPKAAKAVGSITVGGALEFAALDGKGRLYVNQEDRNMIAVVNLAARKVIGAYALPGCKAPTGLAYVDGDRLISACANGVAAVVNATTGASVATLHVGVGPDAVLYDKARKLAYIPSGRAGTLSVIALSGPADGTVVATVTTQVGARTGAVDLKTGRIYLPTAAYAPLSPGQKPGPTPGTFQVLVLDRS